MTQNQTLTLPIAERHTDGVWMHTGRLILSVKLDDGQVIKVTLPDDLVGVTAVNSLEDLTYGG
jgi:hypothetical protein